MDIPIGLLCYPIFPYSVVGGCPCRLLKSRIQNKNEDRDFDFAPGN